MMAARPDTPPREVSPSPGEEKFNAGKDMDERSVSLGGVNMDERSVNLGGANDQPKVGGELPDWEMCHQSDDGSITLLASTDTIRWHHGKRWDSCDPELEMEQGPLLQLT